MKSEDIAKIAGVSRSTVSRVINNYTNVPEETRKKVMEVIEKYDYSPNAFARTLAGKKSETIGVFFIIEDGHESKLNYNDFYTAYLDAIVDVANEKGYYVLVQTITSDKDYMKVNKAFQEKRIDGGILIGTRADTFDRIDLKRIKNELVIFDYEHCEHKDLTDKKNISIINSNDEASIELAVKHLVECGHKEIGFIRGIRETLSARKRYEGFKKAAKKYDVLVQDKFILKGEFNQEITYAKMQEAIKNKQVAQSYICANDYMAIAAIECLSEHGFEVPSDVSFIGFDNTRTGQLMTPKLTTLTPNFIGMSKKAVEIIHQRNMDEEAEVEKLIEYKVDLLIRDSVKLNTDEITT